VCSDCIATQEEDAIYNKTAFKERLALDGVLEILILTGRCEDPEERETGMWEI
jgi:hypothetical protein